VVFGNLVYRWQSQVGYGRSTMARLIYIAHGSKPRMPNIGPLSVRDRITFVDKACSFAEERYALEGWSRRVIDLDARPAIDSCEWTEGVGAMSLIDIAAGVVPTKRKDIQDIPSAALHLSIS